MKKFIALTIILAFVAAVASGALALTYSKTKPAIAAAEKQEEAAALKTVFFNGFKNIEQVEKDGGKYYKVFIKGDTDEPSYYAVTGAGIGYNKSSPIELLVGFVNPQKAGVKLPDGSVVAEKGFVCAGWKVIKSQETPGLGENAKNTKPAFTWLGKIMGKPDDTSLDRRTSFQQQFSNKLPQDMVAKKTIEVITGATYSTEGIISAVKHAQQKLEKMLGK